MTAKKENVKALILSGGGVKGTFQYGAIDHIYNHVLAEGERFKIVCGVSAGAMNGSIIIQDKFKFGKDIWMEQIEEGVPAFDMRYSKFTLLLHAILPGIFTLKKLQKAHSIYVNKKLREILNETSKDLVRIVEENDDYLRLGIVEYQTAKYLSIDPTSPGYRDKVVDVIIASTAIPIAFPSVRLNNFQYFDGGVINTIPFADIFKITREREFKDKYNLTSIYSVLCSPLSTNETSHDYNGLIDIAWRTLDILLKEIYVNDKQLFNRTNAYVLFREEIEKIIPDREKLEKIYEKIKTETGVNVTKYITAQDKLIAPEPEEWKNFLESDLYPEGIKMQGPINEDSVKMFWEQWPSTLSKDKDQLMLCYHFGMYMARKVLGSNH
jgi:NTE family protein